ncbi:Dor1-like family-domain-containing protein [Coprinopsis sp. MPI-PUGE-AT-0042]|nr:Dor1-like family-domain-containing protein [Coprinopsis sp. MPI-PUGE-AT-0042]
MDETQPVASTSKLVDVSSLAELLTSSSPDKGASEGTLNKAKSKDYLSKLTAFSISDLFSEPTALQTQSHHLTSSLTSLTHTSYPTFLSLHRTTTALTTSLETLASSLDSLLNKSLPALEDSATNWKQRTEDVLRERGRALLVLDQHDKIRDLLDIPLLIDACVRNGYFSEALSLSAHAKALSSSASFKEQTPPLVLQSVLSEVHNSVTLMLLSLLGTLYEPNRKLPALWKAVNFLRKMDAFGPSSPFATLDSKSKKPIYLSSEDVVNPEDEITNEEQIALAFLAGRESCLQSSLEAVGSDVRRLSKRDELDEREKEDLARYLKKYIDVWREGSYDVITQYTTIFLEKSTTASSQRTQTPQSATSTESQQEFLRLHSLITTFASYTLNAHLIPILSPALPLLSVSLLQSLLTQLTYCSTAFARVGLDFKGMLSLLFADAILQVVAHDVRDASKQWAQRLTKASGSPTTNSRDRKQVTPPSKWLVMSSSVSSPPLPNPSSPQGPAHIPPQLLASYPPLAEHTNSLLGVFNALRLLPALSILADLVEILDDVLADGAHALIMYLNRYSSSLSQSTAITDDDIERRKRDIRVAQAVGEVYLAVFLPFMRRALVDGVYGHSEEIKSETSGTKMKAVNEKWEKLKKELQERESS